MDVSNVPNTLCYQTYEGKVNGEEENNVYCVHDEVIALGISIANMVKDPVYIWRVLICVYFATEAFFCFMDWNENLDIGEYLTKHADYD